MTDYDWQTETAEPLASATYILALKDTGVGAEPLQEMFVSASGFAAASHTHTAANVTDFSEAVDDRVSALLVAGSNITLTYNDGAGTLTVAASGGGGLTLGQAYAAAQGIFFT